MQSQPSRFEISDLPQEVLQIIFEYLSTNERKAVKLVCKCWFQACNVPSLLKDEVLRCYGLYKLSDINLLLEKSERIFLNLKFEQVNFNEDLSFWKHNGLKFRSITFKHCEFSTGTLEKIIIHCQNLSHLSLPCKTSLRYFRGNAIKINWSSWEYLMILSKSGIVCENLNSLKIHIHSNFDDCLLDSVFPRLKGLKLFCTNSIEDKIFVPVLSYLTASVDRIEKLKLYFPEAHLSSNTVQRLLKILTSMKRLTELSIELGDALNQDAIVKLNHAIPLKSLVFSPDGPVEPALIESLISNSNLKHLELRATTINYSTFTKSHFAKFLSSRLKTFKLYIPDSIMIELDFLSSCSSAESKPTIPPRLSIRVPRSQFERPLEGEYGKFIQKYRHNLHHLECYDIYYNDLHSILKNQTKFKSLIIKVNNHYGDFYTRKRHLNGFNNSFNQLTDVEHLELCKWISSIFLKSLTPCSKLANLKYLKISLFNKDKILIDFLKLADAAPFLEGLCVLDCGTIPFIHCVELCTRLSRLQFLRWERLGNFEPSCTHELFVNLFSLCSSLRVLSYFSDTIYNYFFDAINKKVVRVMREDFIWYTPYIFSKPKISGYTVDWLVFHSK